MKPKNNDEVKKYNSVQQEWKRHFYVKKKLKNDFVNINNAWEVLKKVVIKQYDLPKDFDFYLGSVAETKKRTATVDVLVDMPKKKELAVSIVAIDKSVKKEIGTNKFTSGFVLKAKGDKVKIKYTEHVYAYAEMFGLKATLSKFGFKRVVSKNKKILENELKKFLTVFLQEQELKTQEKQEK